VKRVGLLVSLLVGLLAGLLVVASVSAQTPTPNRRPNPDDVNRVAKKLYCPVCENEPLNVCQTPACVQWKAQIAQYLAEGKSDDEIVQIFVDQFGLVVQGEPPFSGVTVLLWIGPIVFALLAGFYTIRLIRRMAARPARGTPPPVEKPASTGDRYLDQVESDLKQRL